MKYTKKMKLVEFKDDIQQPHNPNYTYNDTAYAQPKVLHNLDGTMSEILFNNELSDIDKCTLYNQTLQRYLHFVKQNQKQPSTNHNTQTTQHIPESFDNTVLSSPVRSFFENVRNSNANDQLFPFKTTPPQPIPLHIAEQPKKKRSKKIQDYPMQTPRRKKNIKRFTTSLKDSQIPRYTTRATSTRNRMIKPCSVVLERWVQSNMN